MNILFYCNEYPPYACGGIGTFTYELSVELAKSGNNVYIIGIYDIDKCVHEIIDGVNIYRYPKSKKWFNHIYNRYKMYFSIKELIKKQKIDILEVQDFNGLLALYSKFNCTTVVRLHGSVYYFKSLLNQIKLKDKIWYFLERQTLLKADKIVSVSDFTAKKTKELFNLHDTEIVTIHNGVNVMNDFNFKKQGGIKKFCFAGSMIKKKGIIELIDAWIIFSNGRGDVELHIFGKDIENHAENILKLNCESIIIHGAVDKKSLENFFKDIDFCIFPTKAEAFSLAPLEAMAASKVVLYSNQTSYDELVTKYNAITINESSSPAILDALIFADSLSNEDCLKVAKNGYETVIDRFNVKTKNIENIKFYSLLLSDK